MRGECSSRLAPNAALGGVGDSSSSSADSLTLSDCWRLGRRVIVGYGHPTRKENALLWPQIEV